ncbi:MAG: GNAT family N-acetyltransferase [Eubacterium sp.]|nr:GNAT family N-acetyltransferase [Eubacterium sp.]
MLQHTGTQTIQTARLTLRKIRPEDSADFFTLCSKPAVSRFVTWNTHESKEVTDALVQGWVQSYRDDRYLWAIVYRDRVIGNVDVINITGAVAELGWMLDEAFWNQGLMTEAASAVRDYLFDTVGLEALTACHVAENFGSGRVMQKIGMHFWKYIAFSNKAIPKLYGKRLCVYCLTKEEWEAMRRRSSSLTV